MWGPLAGWARAQRATASTQLEPTPQPAHAQHQHAYVQEKPKITHWERVKLNDGRTIPALGFGTWKIPQSVCTEQAGQALDVGFTHFDTAQSYGNEQQLGDALSKAKIDRSKIWITTKHSRDEGIESFEGSLNDSLKNMSLDYVDLYLIHHPILAKPDIKTSWEEMEKLQKAGKAKSIGVSNYGITHLQTLLKSAKIKPAVNQIEFHPECLDTQLPIHEFGTTHGIVTEAYSLLTPITQNPSGPVSQTVSTIATRLNLTSDQVLMAWAHSKGAIVVSTSSKKPRLEGYIKAGHIQLSSSDISLIDAAGLKTCRLRRLSATGQSVFVALVAVGAFVNFGRVFGLF